MRSGRRGWGTCACVAFLCREPKIPAADHKAKRYVRENWPRFVPEAMRIIRHVFDALVKEPRMSMADYIMVGKDPPDDFNSMANYSYDHVLRDAKLLTRIHDESYFIVEIEPDHWIICRTLPKDRLHDALWVLPDGQTRSFTHRF